MHLNSEDYERILKFYNDALNEFGKYDPRSLHWASIYNQHTRFQTLIDIGNLQGKSVLDVGCGLGDLYKFLLQKQILVEYTGIDLIPEYIKIAQEKYAGPRFFCKDIFDVTEQYDYVLASGALSFKVYKNDTHTKKMIKKMYEVARHGVAFNMLNKKLHIDDETFAAYTPEKVEKFCTTFCDNIQIITGYLPEDFTIYLYKN